MRKILERLSPFLAVALIAVAALTILIEDARTQPVDAGNEPESEPIIYGLIPGEGAVVPKSELSRAGATIETRRDVGVWSAEVFVDGKRRPAALMGPTRYLQSTSVDVMDLEPGFHSLLVVATDSAGRAGGYSWTFLVVAGR